MARNAIVEQTRRTRDRLAKTFGYDVRKIARALQQEEATGGRELVTLPPKKLRPSRSKAG